MRADRRVLVVLAAAGAIDAAALVLPAARPHAWILLPAGLLHLLAAAVVLRLPGTEPTRRLLAAAMTFSLPLAGVAMAVLAVLVRGRGGDELLVTREPVQRSGSGASLAQRLTGGGPVCELLLAADAETRRVAVTALKREADARAIALLRWAVAQPHSDLALEAALALEELSARYAEVSAGACAEAERLPSRDSALAAAEALARAIHNGLAEPALVPAIAARARDHYRAAARFDEQRAGELAWARARLELAMLDPDAALALIEPVLGARAGDARLLELYRDAAHAARRFELLPPAKPPRPVPRLAPAPSLAQALPLGPEPPRGEPAGRSESTAHDRPEPSGEPERRDDSRRLDYEPRHELLVKPCLTPIGASP